LQGRRAASLELKHLVPEHARPLHLEREHDAERALLRHVHALEVDEPLRAVHHGVADTLQRLQDGRVDAQLGVLQRRLELEPLVGLLPLADGNVA